MKYAFLFLFSFVLAACSSDGSAPVTPQELLDELSSLQEDLTDQVSDLPPEPSSAPDFVVLSASRTTLPNVDRQVNVFDLPVYAIAGVEESRLIHAAHIMAQYLDNDEDGKVDNLKVWRAMKSAGAFMLMWNRESDLEGISESQAQSGQDLGNAETRPEWHVNKTGEFDAALEEVLHLITHVGYARAYPHVFGEMIGSELANAMDVARGGQFTEVPATYPAAAWYTYDDTTCDYSCMAAEYIYWGITSIAGAQENRLSEIDDEWDLNTKDKVMTTDQALYRLLTNAEYRIPLVRPDGSYRSQ